MARPRQFDEESAVGHAMEAFWAGGYEGTSTEQLCEATGLGRSSIYNTFSSKRELFRRSLRTYCETATGWHTELLEQPGPARPKLRRLLTRVVDDEVNGDGRGCLVVNTTIEFGGRDEEISAEIQRDAARLVAAVRAVIEAGQRDGEIDPAKNALALARFLHAQVGGIRLQARAGASRTALLSLVDVAMSAI
jgi:TetR/AcrR family transcriptional regulator, transcriptional repressor for nem operon